MRVTVFLAHGDGLTFGFGLWLAFAGLDPPDTGGVLADVVVPPEGAFVPAVGFGDELSLADADGESDPPWLADVLGVGDGGLIAPIPGEGDAEGLALTQFREVEEPPNGKIPPTGALLCVFTLPDPPLPPPPEPVFPPDELAELALLGKISCWASRATYAPAATMETVTPSAASGRSQLRVRAARPPPLPEVGPNRSQATRVALATHSDADWNPPGARSIMSVQTASAQASASGRGRPSRL